MYYFRILIRHLLNISLLVNKKLSNIFNWLVSLFTHMSILVLYVNNYLSNNFNYYFKNQLLLFYYYTGKPVRYVYTQYVDTPKLHLFFNKLDGLIVYINYYSLSLLAVSSILYNYIVDCILYLYNVLLPKTNYLLYCIVVRISNIIFNNRYNQLYSRFIYLLLTMLMLFFLYYTMLTNYYTLIYIYIGLLLFMSLLLVLFTVIYMHFGYQIVFVTYMQLYALFTPVVLCLLVISFVYDFDSIVMFRLSSYILQDSFNLISFRIDNVSVVFSTTTLIIGFFTGMFQYTYMSSDTKKDRFFFLINYFVLSMVFFVHSSNYILMLLFWEFLGITSFFLISHYDSRYTTIKSALKAFSFNRLSDVFMLLFVSIQYYKTGHFYMFSQYGYKVEFTIGVLPLLLLILSSFIKSAQLFFFFWLPDSMEAPIPASALIHSATLVSAGIYILLRFRYDIMLWPVLCKLIIYVPTITILLFTPFIFVQTDLKRLLALSTVVNISFLYLMIVVLDTKYVCFYFIIHGLFKSCSFLILGILILLNKHSQDYRSYTFGIQNPAYVGFLMSFCVLLLSGSNLIFVYSIKHVIVYSTSVVIKNNFVFNFVTIVYSLFSILYGLKVTYVICVKSTKNRISDNYRLNLVDFNALSFINSVVSFYLLLSILIAMVSYLYIFKIDFFILNSVIRPLIGVYNIFTFGYLFILFSLPTYIIFVGNRYFIPLMVYTICILFYSII